MAMNDVLARLWLVRPLPPAQEAAFVLQFHRHSFAVATIAAVLVAITATVFTIVGFYVHVPRSGASPTLPPYVLLPIIWSLPVVFIIFKNWCVNRYHWLVLLVFSIFIFRSMRDAVLMIFEDPTQVEILRLQLRVIMIYLFVIVFLRVPYRFSLVVCILTIPPIVFILATAGFEEGGPFAALSVTFMIILSLVTSFVLEDRERRLFLHQLANDNHEEAQVQTMAQLRKKNEEVEEAYQRAHHFVDRAVHDIRNAATALTSNITLAKRALDRANNPRLAESLARADQGVPRFTERLKQLASYTELATGETEIRDGHVEINALLQEIQEQMRPLADEKGIAFRVKARGMQCYARTDPKKLYQIVLNLVSNAIKFTDPRPPRPQPKGLKRSKRESPYGGILVGVACSSGGQKVRIDVWDTGCGIPADQQDAIRQPYMRVPGTKAEGRGLGLAIANTAANHIGGKLEIRSVTGRGSHFFLYIPYAIEQVSDEATVSPTPTLSSFEGRKVVLLEDDENVRRALETELQDLGLRVECSGASWQEVFHAMSERGVSPDIIVSDFELVGTETAAQAIPLLRNYVGREVPALVITGRPQMATIALRKCPNIRVLGKPHNPVALQGELSAMLSQQPSLALA